MKVTAECIESGECPISKGGSNAAWDENNPFKNLEESNKVAPPIKETPKDP
jgi:hypothetical protein